VTVAGIPYRFERTHSCAEVAASHADLAPGEESGETVSVAGRLMLLRVQGRVAFAECRDWTGSVQLFALEAVTADFEGFCKRNLGDWVGATGEVVRTRRGELSVKVASWTLLAEARRSFGDKWRGIADPDLRYRQREVDLWANEGVREVFLMRSRAIASIRRRLDALGFVEVETPILLPIPGGANAKPFVTYYNAMHSDNYLRVATELYLKRLVVGGFEKVYEIGRTFRNEGVSPRHNPEFTMLELYQAYADLSDMMLLVEDLVAGTAQELLGETVISYQGRRLDLTPPWRRASMEELIAENAGVEATLAMGAGELRRIAGSLGVEVAAGEGPGKVLLEIYEKTTEPKIWDPVFVCDYPQEVSPLARVHRDRPGYVERFEPVVAGRELGNAFSELTDPDDQRERFLAQADRKAAGDEDAMSVDWEFLRALEHGLPPTGGLGIGIDRVIMLLADVSHIREVLLFPALRPLPREPGRDSGRAGEPGGGRDGESGGREPPAAPSV
jgi:lysyl-tRNA synthetase, class II